MKITSAIAVVTIILLNFISPRPAVAMKPDSVNRVEVSFDKLYKGFQEPPAEARPFVRWWWNDNRVEETEVLRELDLLKEAGIGGIEINPIAAREEDYVTQVDQLTWRSPEWDRVLHTACKGAHKRGLIVDLIAGSGWPFGGEFLKPDEQIMRVSLVDENVKGPASVTLSSEDIFNRTHLYHNRKEKFINPSIAFVSLYPRLLTSQDQIQDISGLISEEGILKVEVPEGEHIITFGLLEQGYRKVAYGVKGAMGPTIDHLQKRVVRMYLDRLKGVEQTWGQPLSTYVRAIFCDSIETAWANWTHDITNLFIKKTGYDIRPFLPIIIHPENDVIIPSDAFADTLRRARYDWNAFLVELFLDNFTSEYTAFCHENQLFSRYQSYGTPYLMGMAEGYMIPDLPEGNNWLYTSVDPYAEGRFTSSYGHGYMVWTKYAAAGGHLCGKKIISTEAMTSLKVFHCTLGTIKQADDMNFIAGITHSVLHGFNYVPPDVPFPGLIRFGTYFSEHNTWWPYFKRWVDYNARLSYLFQSTKPVSEIAIIGPTADLWSRFGLVRGPFHTTPAYLHQLWESIAQLGATCDYLHEAVIQNADVRDRTLCYGPMAYKVLLVIDMQSMLPKTAQAIRRFAEKGGTVIYVNQIPVRSPCMMQAVENDTQVAEAVAASLKAGAKKVPAPSNQKPLRDWLRDILKDVGFTFDLVVKQPRDGLYQIRHTASNEDIIFFTNTYRKESSRTRVQFFLGDRGLWRWDPETGKRNPYTLPYDKDGFELDLRPLESILLVTGKKIKPASICRVSTGTEPSRIIAGPWRLEFAPAQSGRRFTTTMESLSDFTQSADGRIRKFSGTVTYSTTFDLDDLNYDCLELGWDNDFISEIFLNGKTVGVNWYGSKCFDISDVLKPGENKLVIQYTTTLYNKMKAPTQPSGLMGPVRLIAKKLKSQ